MIDFLIQNSLRLGCHNTTAVSAPLGGFFIANKLSFPEVPTNREAWAAAVVAVTDSQGFFISGD